MIWYLLYPLRGLVSQGLKTTEAPVLPQSHPLRKAFTRYGRYAARHVVTTLLVSAAVATLLLYPIPFLFTTDFINGASNLPHHAWTVAQPLPYHMSSEPDIIMRSIWVHGSYMQALNPELLASALDLQDELLGVTEDFDPHVAMDDAPPTAGGPDLSLSQRDAVHAINGLTNQSWFFHSPLQYWGCSKERILKDTDLVATVNEMKTMSSPVNVTLRHSVVFSGKRFEYRRLLAADALVITLLHSRDSPVGRQWARKSAALAKRATAEWDVYPPDGRITTSRLYEFQFRPISTQDTLTLTLAYGLAFGYFVMSLFKVRAVKSKVGLMITVVTQIVFAIMSSFTVCAIFNIDLSRIPRAAYPLVILAMSLENVFRLINAVILTPAKDSTSSRMSHAFGETAPVALVSTLQNVVILTVLSRLVSPGVSAFCIFLAVAIVFDVFYLSTFFLAVLSIDVRRTELSDALAKASSRHNRQSMDAKGRTWIGEVIHGRTALSTRIAGTFVMVGFIVMAQWHFFQEQTVLNTTIGFFWESLAFLFGTSKPSALEEINQARSPTSWLRLQDHETAQELINIIKPQAHSYVAQVYEPLVFVRKGSDRNRRGSEPTLLPAYYDFMNHQLTQFVIIVLVVIAALRLLISYLLYGDETSPDDDIDYEDVPRLSVGSVPDGHTLDIAMLTSSSKGHVISVGLDRIIRIWDMRKNRSSYALPELSSESNSIFPILALATNEESTWLAILSTYQVTFWSLADRVWGPAFAIDTGGQKPEVMFFPIQSPHDPPHLVLVRRNGTVLDITASVNGQVEESVICETPLVCAEYLDIKGTAQLPPRSYIVAVSKEGSIRLASRGKTGWGSGEVPSLELGGQKAHQVLGMSSLGLFAVATSTRVLVYSIDNCEILYMVETDGFKPMKHRSLQCAYSTQRISHVDSPGVTSSTTAYVEAETGDCILHTFTPSEDFDCMGLHAPSGGTDGEGCEWAEAIVTKRRIPRPGHFSLLSDGTVVGIRRKTRPEPEIVDRDHGADGLRNRFSNRGSSKASPIDWEVWTVSPNVRFIADEEQPLFKPKEQPNHLLISNLGPKARVGLMSVAFAFGNVIKFVTVGGPERFDSGVESMNDADMINLSSRRRKMGASWRPRACT